MNYPYTSPTGRKFKISKLEIPQPYRDLQTICVEFSTGEVKNMFWFEIKAYVC